MVPRVGTPNAPVGRGVGRGGLVKSETRTGRTGGGFSEWAGHGFEKPGGGEPEAHAPDTVRKTALLSRTSRTAGVTGKPLAITDLRILRKSRILRFVPLRGKICGPG